MTPDKTDPRLTRSNIILSTRAEQIRLNLLAVAGGRPYIDARLSRLPFESEISWNGQAARPLNSKYFNATGGGHGEGRRARAFLINYAGRITRKINQFVFSTEVQRQKSDSLFRADTTRTGTPIDTFMARVSQIVTAAQWCWISVDRDSLPRDAQGQPVQRSVADKEASGDRVFWSVWTPDEVVDWHFDRTGKLLWLITEQTVYDNEHFDMPATNRPVRTIWQRGEGRRLWLNPEDKTKIDKEETFSTTLDEVGFIPVGTPSAAAWWFDDVEMILAAILNLTSAHHENLFQSVYPQLILPDTMLQTIMDRLKISGEAVMEMIRGLNYPIFEPLEASGLTRYLMPNAGDMTPIPNALDRLREEVMKIVGLALQNPDSRQVQSAESKAWDHLDPEAVLKERTQILEECETKAVALSRRLDNTFAEYQPVYGKTFNVRDIMADMATLMEVKKMGLPAIVDKEFQRAGIELFDRQFGIPEDRKQQYLDAILKAAPAATG